MKRSKIDFIEKNIHGAWVICGEIGFRQYYGYTKREAKAYYKKECTERAVFVCQPERSHVTGKVTVAYGNTTADVRSGIHA